MEKEAFKAQYPDAPLVRKVNPQPSTLNPCAQGDCSCEACLRVLLVLSYLPVARQWSGAAFDLHPHVLLQKENKSKKEAADKGPKRGALEPAGVFVAQHAARSRLLCL